MNGREQELFSLMVAGGVKNSLDGFVEGQMILLSPSMRGVLIFDRPQKDRAIVWSIHNSSVGFFI